MNVRHYGEVALVLVCNRSCLITGSLSHLFPVSLLLVILVLRSMLWTWKGERHCSMLRFIFKC